MGWLYPYNHWNNKGKGVFNKGKMSERFFCLVKLPQIL